MKRSHVIERIMSSAFKVLIVGVVQPRVAQLEGILLIACACMFIHNISTATKTVTVTLIVHLQEHLFVCLWGLRGFTQVSVRA